ncbi:MAG TPA: MFS transporter [Bacteroidia bacterium]|jgi:DHA1 family inner membrane transport protein|nr:MFS transporter [Bacteroidia bacterium]
MTRKELLLLFTLALVQFTHILDNMIMMPMAPNLKRTMDITTQGFGFLVASYGIAAFVSAIAATFYIDRFDRKKSLLVLYIGFLIGTFCCALAPDYNSLMAARIFTGLFGGVAGSVILSIIGDTIPFEKRARGMGILMSGFALASVAGVPLGIYLSENYSWHTPFFLVAFIGLFVLFAAYIFVPNVTNHLKGPKNTDPFNVYKQVLGDRNLVWGLLFSMCIVYTHFSIIPYISDYLVYNQGFSMKGDLVYMYMIGGVLSSVCAPLIGKIADKRGRYKVLVVLSLLACYPLYAISNFSSTAFWPMIGVAATFFVFSGGRMVPAQAMITSVITPHLRGAYMSLNSAAQQLTIGLSTMIGGLIIYNDEAKKIYNYPYVGYIGIGFGLLALLAGNFVKPAKQPAHSVNKEIKQEA